MTGAAGRLRHRIGAACLVASVAVALLPGTFGGSAASADTGGQDSSAMTLSGDGPFSSLKVTVSQTSSLIDQVVRVSWTGGAPTVPTGQSAADYLQIMQCWGDDPSGPDRTQCEYGGQAGNVQGLDSLQTTRQVYVGPAVIDPLETLLPSADNPYASVPFAPVHPNTDPGADNSPGQYFNSLTTNEVPLARTQPDGTGETYFEAMTTREAPGLGCGEQLTDASGNVTGRPCWLVVVPRGETEVNGDPYTAHGGGLQSSPLSASNWAHRIVFPLQFLPIGLVCPIGGNEQRTLGQEMAEEAVLRWQPTLCTNTGVAYGYTPLSDDSSRARLLTPDPGLDFVGAPVDPAVLPKNTQVAYAPVAISGGVIAFNVDTTTFSSSPAELRARNGLRVPDINLTQRLVAKLITQSYQAGAPAFDPAVSKNPTGLATDPDFLAVNPGLKGLTSSLGDVLMPFGSSDLIKELWTWVSADPDAKAFLDGTPDPWGMVVNPAYKGITDAGAINDFPKNDSYCTTANLVPGQTPPCTLDARPYADDMHVAARSAARGDSLAKTLWDVTAIPPGYKKQPTQLTGVRHVMAFTDAATAVRYSLPVAHLRNASGNFVSPTTDALAAGVAAMTPTAVAGVLAPNPTTSSATAYPLTAITYAATVPAALTGSTRTAFAAFLKYAATTGQQLGLDAGQLPYGYLPLTDAMSWQTLQLATQLFAPAAASSTPAPSVTPTKTHATPSVRPTNPKPSKSAVATSVSPSPTVTLTVTPPIPVPTSNAPAYVPPATVATSAPASAAASTASTASMEPTPPPDTTPPIATSAAAAPQPSASERVVSIPAVRTARVQVGADRYLLVIVLAFGGLCAFSGPLLLRLASKRSR